MRAPTTKSPSLGDLARAAAMLPAFLACACAAQYVAAPDYARSLGLDTEQKGTIWTAFAPGAQAVVAPATTGCPEQVAEELAGLDTAPRPLAAEPWAAQATVWTVQSAMVKAAEGGYLAVGLADPSGRRLWIKVPGGNAPACVWPMSADLDAALRLRGNTTVFAPWRPTCKKIEATGVAAASTLLESEPGLGMEVGGVALGEIIETPEGPIRIPWIELHGGTIRVRGDTFRFCFAPVGSPEASPPADGLAMIHMPAGRCDSEETPHGRHVTCSTSVGVWEGTASGDRVSLDMVHRTLGQVHFVGGKPVRGESFAKAVLSVETAETRKPDERTVYDSIRRSVADALADSDGTFRVAGPDDPKVNTRIRVSIDNLVIGELEKGREQDQSEYQDGTRWVHNDRKDQLQQDYMNAQQAVQQAESDYQTAIQNYDIAVQEAVNLCNSGCAMQTDPNYQSICYQSCDIGQVAAGIFKPTRDSVYQAETDAQNAEMAWQNEPTEIEEPIMKMWTYTRQTFGRGASATVRIRIEPKDEQATERTSSFSNTWSDFNVDNDPAHNVQGHPATAAWIDRPQALLPSVGEAVAGMVASEMRTAVSRAALRELRRDAAGAGLESRGGYEDVDAVAVGVARSRLDSRVQTGTSDLSPAGPTVLPSRAVRLAPSDCLLAVAVLPEGQTGAITLSSRSGSHGDLRRKSFAAMEVCAYELKAGEQAAEEIQLAGEAASQVRWGLYRTRADEGAPLPAAPPAPQGPPPLSPQPPAEAVQPRPPTAAPGAAPPGQPAPLPTPKAPPPAITPGPAAATPAAPEPEPTSEAADELQSEDPEVRLAGIALAAAKKDTAALPELKRIVAEDPDPKVRKAAWDAIGKLGTKDDAADLESLRLAEKKPKVRAAARKAVKGLLKKKPD